MTPMPGSQLCRACCMHHCTHTHLVKQEGLVASGLIQQLGRPHNDVAQAALAQQALPRALDPREALALKRVQPWPLLGARAGDQDEVGLLTSWQRLLTCTPA